MIKIYICDDDPDFLKIIKKAMDNYILNSQFNDFEYDVVLFDDPNTTIKKINENQPNIIFLDIDMPKKSGFDIAENIGENQSDTIIIFVTSHDNYVFSSFRYRPFRFIRKTHLLEELSEALESALQELLCGNKYLELGSKYFNEKILLSNIIYFESKRNYAEITTASGQKYMYRSTISELEERLRAYGFLRLQAAFLANMKHIYSIIKSNVVMDNGFEITVSRRLVNDVKLRYSRYLRK